MLEERVAILEAKLNRNEKDILDLLRFVRSHVQKEDEDRRKMLALISDIDSSLKTQKSFWAGMLFAFTGIGTLVGGAITWFRNGGG